MMLSTEDRYRLAIEAECHARTVRRWLDGDTVGRMTAAALRAAAKRLGLELAIDDSTSS